MNTYQPNADYAVVLPNGELSLIDPSIAERYQVAICVGRTPFTGFPIIEVVIPLDPVN